MLPLDRIGFLGFLHLSLLTLVLLLPWAALRIWREPGVISKPLAAAFALPVLAVAISSFLAVNPALARHFAVALVLLLLKGWLIAQFADSGQIRRFEKATLLVGILVIAFGYYQFLADTFGAPSYITALRPQYSSGATFIFPRVQSTALEPLYLDFYLLLPLFLIVVQLRQRGLRTWEKVFLVALMALFITTVARGAILAGLIAFGFVVWNQRHDPRFIKRVAVATIIALVASLVLVEIPGIINNQNSVKAFSRHASDIQDESAFTRYQLWPRAWPALQKHPLFGYGPNNTQTYLPLIKNGQVTDRKVESYNNDYLTTLTELGLAGVLLFLPLAIMVWLRIKEALAKSLTSLSAPYAVTFIAMAVQAATFQSILLLRTWTVLALLLATSRMDGARLDHED